MWTKRFELVARHHIDLKDLSSLLNARFNKEFNIYESPLYKVDCSKDESERLENIKEIISDNVLHAIYDGPYDQRNHICSIEVTFLPGVTDNSAHALEESLSLFDIEANCFSGSLFHICSEDFDQIDAKEVFEIISPLVGNPLIQQIQFISQKDFLNSKRFDRPQLPTVEIDHSKESVEISLELSDEKLIELSDRMCLALNLSELKTIREHYYNDEKIKAKRAKLGLPVGPTDVELEVLAQTWSEHCKHKIFAANINFKKKDGSVENIDSLYKTYVKKATRDLEEGGIEWLVSVFSDNAGIVRFDENIDLCIKVETHNSPSALDPYGGAITGILGVNRDILGAGLGARPIANTDVFCFASTEIDTKIDPLKLPATLMHPSKLLKGVHKGVEDGGNKSGIPTINGAIMFDQDYAGKPLVFCGTIGTIPATLVDGRPGSDKGAKIGDAIYVAGGSVGADGIHGATFSSMELGESAPATAVQIGDPFTQKRVTDFLLEARDLGLFTCVTDNGAGGISSSIGEMAELTGGATIDLAAHPTKYPGLAPWEIMISESQERMTFAVDPSKIEAFELLAKQRSVNAFKLGYFNDSGLLNVHYHDKLVASMSMEFLHDGLPQLELSAKEPQQWYRKSWIEMPKDKSDISDSEVLLKLLNSENIASKAHWVRQYDHEVKGATISKPFSGKAGIGPGDSGAIDLEVHGGQENSMAVVGCGLAPRYSFIDPNLMAKMAVDEALRNVLSSGADIEKICILDNFCWPDPVISEKNSDGDEKLAQLVLCCQGLYDIAMKYKLPLVSGKDSMKNDFRGKNKYGEALTISIQPTLLVTAMAHGLKENLVRSHLSSGDLVYVFGKEYLSFLGSEYFEMFNLAETKNKEASDLSDWDFSQTYRHHQALSNLTNEKIINCIHDISDGGLACAVAEMLFDNDLGLSVNCELDTFSLFAQGPGRYVLGVNPKNKQSFEKYCQDKNLDVQLLGQTDDSAQLKLSNQWRSSLAISDVKNAWLRDWSEIGEA